MAQKQQEQKPQLYVTISSDGKTARFETWRYWEIVGELQFMGADRFDAIEAAKWAARAQAGEWYRICPLELIKDPMTAMTVDRIKKGEIKMEVTNG